MPAATVSSRREIHRHIRTLLQRRPPPPPPPPPQPPMQFPSFFGSDDSGSSTEDEASASRKKTRIASPPPTTTRILGSDSVHKQEEGIGKQEEASAFEEDKEVMNEDEEVEIEDNVGDSESHSEDQVDEEDLMEEDDDEDLGSDDSGHEHEEEGSHEQTSAVVAAAADVRVRTTRTAVANVCDADALECGVCFLTLRPPIFQCEVGHVVCSACRDKLEATGNAKCHVCGVATTCYRRCHAMEHLLDFIRVPCPYKAHGCDTTPPYHSQESHRQVCPHAPCHCPGESCGFIGSTTTLLDHFAGAHNWPCTTKVRAKEPFSIRLHDGFNFFLLADHASNDGDHDQLATNCSVPCRLFLLNVTQERLGRAISVLCIHPHASAVAANGAQQLPSTKCELVFSRYGDGSLCHSHYQSSVFKVVCTALSNGLPNPEGCFQFFVPNTVLGVGDDKNSMQIKARIIN